MSVRPVAEVLAEISEGNREEAQQVVDSFDGQDQWVVSELLLYADKPGKFRKAIEALKPYIPTKPLEFGPGVVFQIYRSLDLVPVR